MRCSERTTTEVDVVAAVRKRSGATEVAAIGDAKHTSRLRTVGDLARLDEIRTLLVSRAAIRPSAKLLLFSASGFDRNVTAAARARPDVELIDLERMYTGE